MENTNWTSPNILYSHNFDYVQAHFGNVQGHVRLCRAVAVFFMFLYVRTRSVSVLIRFVSVQARFGFCTGIYFAAVQSLIYNFWSDQQNFLYTSFSLNLRISILLMPYCTALSYSISIKIRRIQIRLIQYFRFIVSTSNVLNT